MIQRNVYRQGLLELLLSAGSEYISVARIESIQRTGKNAGAYLRHIIMCSLRHLIQALPAGVRQVKKMKLTHLPW